MSTEARIALTAAVRLLKLRGYRPRDWQAASAILREHVGLAVDRFAEDLAEAGFAAAREISGRGL